MKRMICAALALCALVLSSPAFAQQTTGNITGRITDDQNAAIPGVTVTGMPKYPGIMQDYANTFMSQKAMKIDVFLSSHASQFGMHDKYKPGDAYNPDRFVDPKGFFAAVQSLEKVYLDQVAKERAGK